MFESYVDNSTKINTNNNNNNNNREELFEWSLTHLVSVLVIVTDSAFVFYTSRYVIRMGFSGGASVRSHLMDPLNDFSFQPMLNKDHDLYYPVCGMVH